MGNFRSPEQVKQWWRGWRRRPKSDLERPNFRPSRRRDSAYNPDFEIQDRYYDDLWALEMYADSFGSSRHEQPELQSSVAAAILMSSPSMMINFAVGAFLTGIGVYLGFVWKNDLDTLASKSESRNVFICFLISFVFCYSFYGLPLLSKLWEDYRKSDGKEVEIQREFLTAVRNVLHRMRNMEDKYVNGDAARQKQLLSSINILITGLRYPDSQSCSEASKAVGEIDRLLTLWGGKDGEKMEKEMKEREKMGREIDAGTYRAAQFEALSE
jgi:hypothetical protein